MKPRINLSPQIAAIVPIVNTNRKAKGKGMPPQSASPVARITPKMNLKMIVTALNSASL
jgi:hypothetical protein